MGASYYTQKLPDLIYVPGEDVPYRKIECDVCGDLDVCRPRYGRYRERPRRFRTWWICEWCWRLAHTRTPNDFKEGQHVRVSMYGRCCGISPPGIDTGIVVGFGRASKAILVARDGFKIVNSYHPAFWEPA